MFKKELTQVFKNKLIIGGLIIALFIPVMYSATFLWSFWEPYDKTDVMKVAIVNEDKGITIKDEEIQFGKNIVKIL
ncbi:MAG TPA: YhgE/Pip domain-containing protein, partial [Pseudogracilibacillus sp.]|nr:YhgE/Pip domain-containing protein [Pseudogracilibacillus sp.]